MPTFALQPNPEDIQALADQYWIELGEAYQAIETAAFEAGQNLREGARSRENLVAIVTWKSPSTVA